jgi:hypothetical protein
VVHVQEDRTWEVPLLVTPATGGWISQVVPAINHHPVLARQSQMQRSYVDQNLFPGHRDTIFAISVFTYLYTVT